jgi:hypothetical protein
MKFTELKVGTTYAVIPSWDYSSADKKNADKVQRRSVARAELLSLEKYEYQVFRSETKDNPNFKPAPKGSRAVGYLVASSDWSKPNVTVNANHPDDKIYWLARPQDIVAEYSTLETRWANQEAEEERIRKEHEARRAEEERVENEARAYAERIVTSCTEVLTSILGDRIKNVQGSVSRKRDVVTGNYIPCAEFIIDGRTMQYLAEKILEAQDLVA